MLTFAASSPSATATAAAALHPGAHFTDIQDEQASPPARPAGFGSQAFTTYWPCGLLNTFTLRMAAAGHCVNTDMMLGHRPYAQERLAEAAASSDGTLRTLAARLQVYFDAAAPDCCHVATALDEAQPGRLLLV